ncbi:MAG: hypothetical protein ABEJ58_07020, partial [Halodesulfurarchaeum sp.]
MRDRIAPLFVLSLIVLGTIPTGGAATTVEDGSSSVIPDDESAPISAQSHIEAGPLSHASSGSNRIHSAISSGQLHARSVATSGDGEIVRTMTLALTPDRAGTIDVTLSFDIPETVVDLTTSIPEDATVTATTGFSRDGSGNYTWDGETPSPSLTVSLPANETGAYHYERIRNRQKNLDRGETSTQGLVFADTGPWAIVDIPNLYTAWTYRGRPQPTLRREVRVAGSGHAGTAIAYLGPNEAYSKTVGEQRITLVVPEAAELKPSRNELFESLRAAADRLRVAGTPDRSVLIAAPTDVDWGPYGLAERPDAWVRADRPLDSPNNVWLHEYVHLRQNFTTATSARWVLEATGEYYATYLTLVQGRIGFQTFQDHLEEGERSRFASSILTQPDTWVRLADYKKGGLVYGTLDRRIRLATGSRHTAAALFRAMNHRGEPVTNRFLRETVTSLAGAETARYFTSATTTTGTPTMWTRGEHLEAFSTLPPQMLSTVSDRFRISGP